MYLNIIKQKTKQITIVIVPLKYPEGYMETQGSASQEQSEEEDASKSAQKSRKRKSMGEIL